MKIIIIIIIIYNSRRHLVNNQPREGPHWQTQVKEYIMPEWLFYTPLNDQWQIQLVRGIQSIKKNGKKLLTGSLQIFFKPANDRKRR